MTENEINKIKSAAQLRKHIIDNQINIIYKHIVSEALKGHFKITLKTDFVLSDVCKAFYSRLGYNLNEMHTVKDKEDLSNYYEISWK